MKTMSAYEIIIVGGGPAGLAAAIEAHKSGARNILVLERDRELGGILMQCIHNGFGLHIFKEELTGPEYAERFIRELESLGIEYRLDTMVLEVRDDRSVDIISAKHGFETLQAKAVVLAMGCRERTRGAINIPGTRPAGVYSAGAAQRFVNMEGFMVGKRVVVLGSGDIGLIMARRMTLEGAKVLAVAEILPYSGGLTRNIVQCLDDYDIPLYLSHTIVNIEGRDRVEGVTIAKVDENRQPVPGTEIHYACDTLLLSVGLIPENELSKSAGIQLDRVTGGPIVNESMETSVPGIFACGNVVQVHDLVDWVTEESRKAGHNAARYALGKLSAQAADLATKAGQGIRYVVPHTIRVANLEKEVDLMMRVTDPFKNKYLVVRHGGDVVKKAKKAHLTPGEMESIKIPVEKLQGLTGELTVCLEEVAHEA
jgi:NADPH-dependent 2,4-dienoyl-CoA reductase/sulfur reductase-like enzyme